jgi:formate hydrogenlyase transcriptional activator
MFVRTLRGGLTAEDSVEQLIGEARHGDARHGDARHGDALQLERDRLRLLHRITSSIASKLDVPELLESLATDLMGVAGCDACAVMLPDVDHGELRAKMLYDSDPRGAFGEGSRLPIEASMCGKVYRTGRSVHVDRFEDQQDDPDSFGLVDGDRVFKRVMAEGFQSGFHAPMVGRHGMIGVFAGLCREEQGLADDDLVFLQQVAAQVAIAVDYAMDYERSGTPYPAGPALPGGRYARTGDAAIIGKSVALVGALDLVAIVAPTDSTVLIFGETGTGKELIAQAVHALSGRRDRPFVKLNCAAIPLGLLESELFGHERGAFTGAVSQKIGRFEMAHRGTLFLDEVGDMPLELQAKLLRVLQEQEFERLGSNRTQRVDVRVIAATRRDLRTMVRQMTFREDLYYRLNVFPVAVPPLRQRAEDIPQLVWHFTRHYARRMNRRIDEVPRDTMDALMRYPWPGNVRELQNFIERAVILSPRHVLRAPIAELEPSSDASAAPLGTLALVERDHILRALEASNWVVGGPHGAAARLGAKRTSLLYRMRKLHIGRPEAALSAG